MGSTFLRTGTTLDNSPISMSVNTLRSCASSMIRAEYFVNRKSYRRQGEQKIIKSIQIFFSLINTFTLYKQLQYQRNTGRNSVILV